VGDKLLLRLNI
jgi:hypothetical protein